MRLRPFTLTGRHVRLEPISPVHADELVAAASIDRSSYGWTLVPDGREPMLRYIEGLLADAGRDTAVPFVQRRLADDAVVGCTRFMDIRWWGPPTAPAEVEIGGTWLSADAQRTVLNTEAKLLLLTHAFEVWRVHRVAICTDARNERSRAAIERLGAHLDGILRSHRPSAGHLAPAGTARDTAAYSIVAAEWPSVRARLVERLERPGA